MNGGTCGPFSKFPSGEPPYAPRIWNSYKVTEHNCYAYMLNDLADRRTGKSQPGESGGDPINALTCREAILGVLADNKGVVKYISLKRGPKYTARANHYKGFLMVSPDMDFHFARQDNRMLKVYDAMLKSHGFANLNKLDPDSFMKLMFQYCKLRIPEICKYLPTTNANYTTLKSKLKFLYRNSKTWSHKPGSTPISDVDAQGRLIFSPVKADWNFAARSFSGINYNNNCCFFEVPTNSYRKTKSTGSKNSGGMFGGGNNTNNQIVNDAAISTSKAQQEFDNRVRKILGLK